MAKFSPYMYKPKFSKKLTANISPYKPMFYLQRGFITKFVSLL